MSSVVELCRTPELSLQVLLTALEKSESDATNANK